MPSATFISRLPGPRRGCTGGGEGVRKELNHLEDGCSPRPPERPLCPGGLGETWRAPPEARLLGAFPSAVGMPFASERKCSLIFKYFHIKNYTKKAKKTSVPRLFLCTRS